MFGFKRRRRQRIRARPFPAEWEEILARNVPYYRLLDQRERAELRGHIQVFLAEKRFEGCGGLEMTDEIRLTIAAGACILLLGRPGDYYGQMKSIFVYPHHYLAPHERAIGPGLVSAEPDDRAGESWHRGPVVLSWDDVVRGASDERDGRNVVFHEFAHQLDSEAGGLDGAPALADRAAYAEWARVMSAEYDRLIEAAETGRRTLLDQYGATNPAEFFAVATEAFFERPEALRRLHGQLYEQLKAFYNQDPAERVIRTREWGGR
jgi:Mlc titration factor MtfA (ptsG expression regulator)